MTVFYAYLNSITNEAVNRFVIAFASRNVADEWWRALTLGGNPTVASSVRRISPQFYAFIPAIYALDNFFADDNVRDLADAFRGRMFITMENDRPGSPSRGLNIIPPQDIIDHLSGNQFYIRSKTDPNTYWYYDTDKGIIRTSLQHRTQFRISSPFLNKGTILIDTDPVNISFSISTSTIEQLYVTMDASGRLIAAQVPWAVDFGALGDGRVQVVGDELRYISSGDSRSWVLA